MNEVTRILSAIDQGDPLAAEQLLTAGLRRAAQAGRPETRPGKARADSPGHGPGPRAYLRLSTPTAAADLERPGSFLRRRGRGDATHPGRKCPPKRAVKRGGGQAAVGLDQIEIAASDDLRRSAGPGRGPDPALRGRSDRGRTGQAPLLRRAHDQTRRPRFSVSRHERPTLSGRLLGPGSSRKSGRRNHDLPGTIQNVVFAFAKVLCASGRRNTHCLSEDMTWRQRAMTDRDLLSPH